MISEFELVVNGIQAQLEKWETRLLSLQDDLICNRRNSQNRNIKQILGHMIDSASNNTHRIIHLQYRENPLEFPNYATHGNNDRWIAIQNYEEEDWFNLVQLWKYTHLHLAHIIENVNPEKLENVWIAGKADEMVSLKEMIPDFLRHMHLHMDEITELLEK
ncbi:hypothetical protein ACE1ET_10750 [Saccharicrinis sp. FJH62]|uniref:hypothetical protein n=1 Tax=Saccharicrinis sp. FJH62 TaxID=3344657 RepID=UPI0035D45535